MFEKVLLLVVFFIVTIGIGIWFRNKSGDVDKFVLGGRNVGPWLSAFAYGTTYFSAVVFVGYAGQFGWRFGISATWIGLGNALIGSLLAWVILGRRTYVMTRHLGSATMPEFFGKRYDSGSLKIGASVVIFIFLIPYTASLYNGLSKLFTMAFSTETFTIDFRLCILAMAVLTGVYVIAGGYMATAVNSFFQGVIMLVGIVAIIAAVLNSNGGFMAALDGMARVSDSAVSETPGVFASFFGPDPINLLGVLILTSLGTWGLPQMIQKFYSIKSEKAISRGTIISTLFAIVIAGGSYFLGGFGRLFTSQVARAENGQVLYDSIIPAMLSGFAPILIGLAVVLVLSASMSTLSSLVMASASTFTLDFLKGSIVKKMDEKKQLLIIRSLIVVFIVISASIAIFQYNSSVTFIAQLMGISWGALAGAFLAPFLYGLYWKRVSAASIWCNFIFSAAVMIANMIANLTAKTPADNFFPKLLQSPINAGAFTMLAGFVIVPLVTVLTKKPDVEKVESCFSCYEQTVTVKVQQDLGMGADV